MLVHGLSLDAAADLTTEEVVRTLPLSVIQGLAAEAEARGENDVAGMLEAVAVVAGSRVISGVPQCERGLTGGERLHRDVGVQRDEVGAGTQQGDDLAEVA